MPALVILVAIVNVNLVTKSVILYAAIVFGSLQPAAFGERLYVNDLKVPESKDDLLAIQSALMTALDQARAATVCVQLAQGSGSGVIISEDGLVLTAAHVTGGVKKKLKVIMEDGREYEAVSLGLHSENDAAMMQILSDEKFPYVEIESINADAQPKSQLGDWVFSLGHSGGFDEGRGSVVRLGRMVRLAESTVRTDCLLIGGDSGGPLFDLNGVLIGIHSRVGHLASQNMHVPIQVFHKHWDALKASEFIGNGAFAKKKKTGPVVIGMAVEQVDAGLEVTALEPGYPAAVAGLQVSDVITEIGGETMAEKSNLKKLLKASAPDDRMKVKYLRDGVENELELTLKAK